MQKVLTAQEMREVDRLTTVQHAIPSLTLMENAAHSVAQVTKQKFGDDVSAKRFLILCGKGNNGGDGAALARILFQAGARIRVVLFGQIGETQSDARINFESAQEIAQKILGANDAKRFGFSEVANAEEFFSLVKNEEFDCVVDALFGTGLSRPVEGDLKIAIQFINSLRTSSRPPLILSIDIPSGLNADSNEPIGEIVNADVTVSFTAPKLANVFPPASRFNGELHITPIGSPAEVIAQQTSKSFVSEKEDVARWLSETRVRFDSYKKTRGTALIIAGSDNFSGAAALVANSCFASGAGMVTLAVPRAVKEIVAAKTADEVIVKILEETNLKTERADIVAIGCGLSGDEKTRTLIRDSVENRNSPMLLDAEALNALAPFFFRGSEEFPLILTPHVGEFLRLLGTEDKSVAANRIEAVREFASKHNVILVLKGERSLIAAPDGRVVINPTGNAGISRAGAGDTLAGIIAGFLAQSFAAGDANAKETKIGTAFRAVVAALYVAGFAGDIAAEKFGERFMMASDVRDCLKKAITQIGAQEK
jgi:NAD(P)H-hydrate epimerase